MMEKFKLLLNLLGEGFFAQRNPWRNIRPSELAVRQICF